MLVARIHLKPKYTRYHTGYLGVLIAPSLQLFLLWLPANSFSTISVSWERCWLLWHADLTFGSKVLSSNKLQELVASLWAWLHVSVISIGMAASHEQVTSGRKCVEDDDSQEQSPGSSQRCAGELQRKRCKNGPEERRILTMGLWGQGLRDGGLAQSKHCSKVKGKENGVEITSPC